MEDHIYKSHFFCFNMSFFLDIKYRMMYNKFDFFKIKNNAEKGKKHELF